MVEINGAPSAVAQQLYLVSAVATAVLLIGSGVILLRLRPREGADATQYLLWWATLGAVVVTGLSLLASVTSLRVGSVTGFYLLLSLYAVTTGGCAVLGLAYLASVFSRLRRELKSGREMREKLNSQRQELEQLVLTRTDSLRKEILESQKLRKVAEREHARMEKELRLAARLQSAILPQHLSFPWLVAAAQLHPMAQTSGDIYDVFQAKDGSVYLFVADAMGHGTAAALLTMMASAALRSLEREESPAAILSALNAILLKRETGEYLTAVLAQVKESGALTVAHAGHPRMLLLRAGTSRAEPCREGGFALGMFDAAHMPFADENFQLQKGDRMLLYSDGLIEATDINGARFDLTRLGRTMSASTSKGDDVSETAACLVEDVYDHADGGSLEDDIALLIAEYNHT